MFAQNPKKEFVIKYNEDKVREAILKTISTEPNDYKLIKDDTILNEIRILRKGRGIDIGYLVDFTLSKISDEETKVIVEVSRNTGGTINTSLEVSVANTILKTITSKFSAYLSGDVNPSTGKANVPKQGCYIATSIYGSYEAPEVLILRNFRDNYLQKSNVGIVFIKFYYAISPVFVLLTKNMKHLNKLIKWGLDSLVKKIGRTYLD